MACACSMVVTSLVQHTQYTHTHAYTYIHIDVYKPDRSPATSPIVKLQNTTTLSVAAEQFSPLFSASRQVKKNMI